MNAQDPWAGILAPGETILWQGRPDRRPQWATLTRQRMVPAAFSASSCKAAFWSWVETRA